MVAPRKTLVVDEETEALRAVFDTLTRARARGRGEIVRALRSRPEAPSWAEVGRYLGISGTRCQQLHEETSQ